MTKFLLTLLSFSLFLASYAYSKPSSQLEKLSKCMNAMGYGTSGNGESYVAMPSTGNQILVFTSEGAKLVQSGGKEANTPFFVFKAPGQRQLNKTYVERDGSMGTTWFGVEEGKAREGRSKSISINEAVAAAGASAKSFKQQPRKYLEYLDSFLRSRYVRTGNGFRTERTSSGQINTERLQSKMRQTQESLAGLSHCDQVANEDVKAAAKLERDHLVALQKKLKDYEAEVSAFDDRIKAKTTTGGTEEKPSKAVR